MAKTISMISVNFDRTKSQADKLDQIAQRISTQRKALNSEKLRISQNWKSDAAKAYIKKLTVMEDELASAEKQVKNAAKTIREIANNTYNAEKEALLLAQKRTYK